MKLIRPVGREAASKKYDLLTALMAHALAGDKHRQRLILRLMSLITARYNWQRDELTIGQREIARMWCVDERTVKRDMARLRDLGWLIVKRQGARGRVSVLGLGIERILLDTRGTWDNVGPDFTARLGGEPQTGASAPPADPKVVPFPRAVSGVWGAASARLLAEDPALFQAWFSGLRDGGAEGGCVTLIAPSRFHATYLRTHLSERLLTALCRSDASIGRLRIEAEGPA